MTIGDYTLARINLILVGCPSELMRTTPNMSASAPIVIEKNTQRFGFVKSTGYCPPAVVVAGAAVRTQLLASGVVHSWAYVKKGALEIQADDAIGALELMDLVRTALNTKLYGNNSNGNLAMFQAPAMICEVYPFENYFIFELRGHKYRQHYVLDPEGKRLQLDGPAVSVMQKFVTAGTQMPRVETGARYAFAPVIGHSQTVSYGGRHSELLTQTIRNMRNIQQTVSRYQAMRNGLGRKLRVSDAWKPVQIVAALLKAQISPLDFASWYLLEKSEWKNRSKNND